MKTKKNVLRKINYYMSLTDALIVLAWVIVLPTMYDDYKIACIAGVISSIVIRCFIVCSSIRKNREFFRHAPDSRLIKTLEEYPISVINSETKQFIIRILSKRKLDKLNINSKDYEDIVNKKSSKTDKNIMIAIAYSIAFIFGGLFIILETNKFFDNGMVGFGIVLLLIFIGFIAKTIALSINKFKDEIDEQFEWLEGATRSEINDVFNETLVNKHEHNRSCMDLVIFLNEAKQGWSNYMNISDTNKYM